MAIALVAQTVGNSGGVSNANQAITAAATSGNYLTLLYYRSGGLATGAVTSITDTGGNTWSVIDRGAVSGGTNTRTEVWKCQVSASPGTITVNSGTAQTNAWNVVEWSGVATSGEVDAKSPDNSATASSTICLTPTVNTTGSADLIVGVAHFGQTTTTLNTAGFTALTNSDDGAVGSGRGAYLLAAASGTYNVQWTLGAAKAAGVITFALHAASDTSVPWIVAQARGVFRRPPFKARARQAQPIPAQVVVNTTQALPPQPRRRIRPTTWRPKATPNATQPPTGPKFNGSYPVPPQPRAARAAPRLPRRARGAAQPLPVQVTVTAPAWIPNSDSPRPRLPRVRRRVTPVPLPAVTVWIPQADSPRQFWRAKPRARGSQPVPPAQAIVTFPGPLVPQARTSLVVPPFLRAKARQAQPVLAQVVVTVTPVPQQQTRRALRPLLRTRPRATPPVRTAPVVTIQVLPPQPATRRRPWPWRHFGRGAQFIPAQQAITVVVPVTVTGSDRPSTTVTGADHAAATIAGTDKATGSVTSSDRSSATVSGSDRPTSTVS
ncbi:MAG TPA: hypothetical protein VEO01_08585 [Pseudonocardiaceae bacterium]|nr:hypothetical protein [Pseudonocardiaceae bacterium]